MLRVLYLSSKKRQGETVTKNSNKPSTGLEESKQPHSELLVEDAMWPLRAESNPHRIASKKMGTPVL